MNVSLRRLVVATLSVLAVAALLAPTLLACTALCVQVPGQGPFCRQCQDVGYETNATCESFGSCGCFYTQNTCGLYAEAETSTEGALFVADDPTDGVLCGADAAPAHAR